jgi:hypothetical protein
VTGLGVFLPGRVIMTIVIVDAEKRFLLVVNRELIATLMCKKVD